MSTATTGSPASGNEAIVINNQTLLNVNMTNVTKLTTTNYLMWSRQVHALLDGYDLASYINGSTTAPSATVTNGDITSANPEYTHWIRQDKLVYSGLLGVISPTIQPLLSRASTAAEIWETLAATYAKPSRGHIKQLKHQLKSSTKGSKSIDEYVQGLTTIFDKLAILGKVIEHEDQVESILEGLPEEYKTVVDQIEGRDEPPSIADVHERLLNHEAKILSVASSPSFPASANVVSQRNNNNTNNNRHHHKPSPHHQPSNNQWHNNNNSHRSDKTPRPYLGRCQLCGVQGHSARRCTLRIQYQTPTPPPPPPSSRPWQPQAHLANAANPPETQWLLDSGATHHITSDLNNLSFHQPYNGGDEVVIGDGSGLGISHTGSTLFPLPSKTLALNKVLYVPNIHKNLISVYRLCNSNQVSVEFFPASFQVKDLNTGAQLLQGRTRNELYEWPVSPTVATSLFASPTPKTSLSFWHSRLGHPSSSILNSVVSQFALPVLNPSNKQSPCSHCLINKSHKLPFANSSILSNRPLQYVFTDLWSSPITSIDNYKYYLVLIDHYTRYSWLFPLKKKSDVCATFIAYKALVENYFNTRITTLYSDNGGEFVALRPYLTEHGISHLTSPPHTPEHNGVSERKHRHIVETGMTLLSQAAVPKTYWPYAFAAAIYLINRLPTPVLAHLSPYQKLFNKTPNYSRLRVFGCQCFPWLRPYNKHKLEDKSKPCVFLGYSITQSAYLCLDPTTGRVFTSRHVQFDEATFPFKSPISPSPQIDDPISASPSPMVTLVPPASLTAPSPVLRASPPPSSTPHPTPTTELVSSPSNAPSSPESPRQSSCDISSSPSSHSSPTQLSTDHESSPSPSPPPRQPTRTAHRNTQTQNVPQPTQTEPTRHQMQTRSKNNISKPNTKFNLSSLLTSTKTKPFIPKTVNQALRDPNWNPPCSDEINAMIRNRTWSLVPPHPSQNVVGCKWVFTIKQLANGLLDRNKARLVAKGFHQQQGIDYAETFSPVIKSTTIHTVLSTAVTKSWALHQLDVNNAFLQGSLTEEVYMQQPPGFVDRDRPDHVCLLHKPIYGLKQAPRSWYLELRNYLISIGFKNSLADTSLFIYKNGADIAYLLVYVDDIIVTGNSSPLISHVLQSLADRFSIKDPTELHYFLGIEVHRTRQGLHMNQRKYIADLLQKTNMTNAKPVATPMATSPKLTLNSGEALSDLRDYRTIVGSLQYLAFTRPDIAYAVTRLSQFMHRPTHDHWNAAKRVLRYLAGTLSHGVFLKASNKLTLHAFSDADWAGDTDDYVSTQGYVIYLGNHPISWSSKKQRGVTRSSTEAEYRSVANTASELRWICSLLTEMHISLPSTPVIYCDNIGATYLCANPVFHSRMKHIALDYHFIREQVQSGALRVTHVHTNDQLADSFTKALPRTRYQHHCSKIGVHKLPPS
ncbi:unnamed protein product [Microthlaspi erraticum]|uniref:Integrase catalytic domain-containing protein n=1 Tax=Microthlaspi erraticum TaxID=1685480 RepID=A0A6D2K6V8_9BRAS|nr:unnamed protein product [Microthlaspi erraticum]